MTNIHAAGLNHKELNEQIRQCADDCMITDCCGQRFLGAGMGRQNISIKGIPGNALGAYLNGATITVHGNAQDAVGDTMNEGTIVIHGSIGDAAGYAMRGGKILVRGDAGYRAGIHMKAYEQKQPLLVIGGKAGSFLGEYQAGGTIIVLGLTPDEKPIVSNFPGTGMHGGRMILRSDCAGIRFPEQVSIHAASTEEIAEITPVLAEFCAIFNLTLSDLLCSPFTIVTPNSANPYKQMYVAN